MRSPDVNALNTRNFSNGESVDSVETEKARIVLHELEEGWWILAVWHDFCLQFEYI